MGWIADELRKKHGIEVPEKPRELTEEAKNYFDRLKEVSEPKKIQIPSADQVRNALVNQANVFCQRQGKSFQVDDQNQWFINLISLYFAKDERFFDEKYHADSGYKGSGIINTASHAKGLLIAGSYGFGKTLVMRSISKIGIPENRFRFVSCNRVVQEYEAGGPKQMWSYYKGDKCFDDFGTEDKSWFYGKQVEIFKGILEERYNLFLNDGKKTHITTNLTPLDVGKRYGKRLESRLYEAFNIIVVMGSDRRRH